MNHVTHFRTSEDALTACGQVPFYRELDPDVARNLYSTYEWGPFVDCPKCLAARPPEKFLSESKGPDISTNPKDILGAKKVSITKLPGIAQILGGRAMMDGARKYGPYNWRNKSVSAMIYIDAAMRHILAWQERQENATDSGVHHLAHALACLAIILDAQATGHMVDDRPQGGEALHALLDRLNAQLSQAAQ